MISVLHFSHYGFTERRKEEIAGSELEDEPTDRECRS